MAAGIAGTSSINVNVPKTSNKPLKSALDEIRGLSSSILGDIGSLGEGEFALNDQNFANRQGSILAALQQRGTAGSNQTGALGQQTEREKELARLAIQDQLMGQKFSIYQSLASPIASLGSQEFQGNLSSNQLGAQLTAGAQAGALDRYAQQRQASTNALAQIASAFASSGGLGMFGM